MTGKTGSLGGTNIIHDGGTLYLLNYGFPGNGTLNLLDGSTLMMNGTATGGILNVNSGTTFGGIGIINGTTLNFKDGSTLLYTLGSPLTVNNGVIHVDPNTNIAIALGNTKLVRCTPYLVLDMQGTSSLTSADNFLLPKNWTGEYISGNGYYISLGAMTDASDGFLAATAWNSGQSFEIAGVNLGRELLSYNVGTSYRLGRTMSLFGGYDGSYVFDTKTAQHTGYVGGAWRW
jgi:uncharacterized protein with beta-barrel porin domain